MRLKPFRRLTQGFGLLLGLLGFTGIGMTHLIFPGLHCYACPLAVTVCPIGLVQNMVAFGIVPYFWIGCLGIYGMLAGIITIIIRDLSGFVEGVMFAILFMNIFAPLIDQIVLMVKYRERTA